MKPSGGKGITHVACHKCFDPRADNESIYCPHFRLLQGWIGGSRIVILNADSREQALGVLKAVRRRMRVSANQVRCKIME